MKNGDMSYVSYFTNSEMYSLKNFAYTEYYKNGDINYE